MTTYYLIKESELAAIQMALGVGETPLFKEIRSRGSHMGNPAILNKLETWAQAKYESAGIIPTMELKHAIAEFKQELEAEAVEELCNQPPQTK